MIAILREALREYRGQVIGWGIAMILLGITTVPSYEMVAANAESFATMAENLPRALSAFVGDVSEITTARGFLTVKFYALLPLVLGIFAVFSGTGMLARDEEAGVLDLLLAQPVKRWQVYIGRLLANTLATVALVVLCWLGLVAGTFIFAIGISLADMFLPLVSLFAVLLVLHRFALALGQFLPSRRLASFAGMSYLFASFFLSGFAEMNHSLEPLAALTPITYYQSGDAILGLDVVTVLALWLVAEILGVIGLWRFQTRDIRLSGEGGFDALHKLFRRGRSAAKR